MKAISSTYTNLVPAVSYSGGGTYSLTGLTVGKDYVFIKGAADTSCTVTTTSLILAATGVFTATAVSVTLTGTPSTPVTAVVALLQPVRLYAATVASPTLAARQVSIGQFPASNPNWSRIVQISDQYVFGKRGTAIVALSVADFLNMCLQQETGLTWTPPAILTPPVSATAAGTAAATNTLTNDGTNMVDGDTVTIGTKVYTFQAALTDVDGHVLRGASNTASMTNLFHAINGAGGTIGTDYAASTVANTQVTATNPTGTTVVVTAIVSGVAGNVIASTEGSIHLSWATATLTGGTVAAAAFTVLTGSEYNQTYLWQYSADGATWATATGTIAGVAYTGGMTATLTATPTTSASTGYQLRCITTDDAGSFGLTNGSVTTTPVTLTIP